MGKSSVPQNAQERKAEEMVLALAEKHGLTVEAMSTRLLWTLCSGVDSLALADELTELFWATQRINGNGCDLIADQVPGWECNCVLPEHSCPTCEAAARAVYGEEVL
jgi:hypothetical protein